MTYFRAAEGTAREYFSVYDYSASDARAESYRDGGRRSLCGSGDGFSVGGEICVVAYRNACFVNAGIF